MVQYCIWCVTSKRPISQVIRLSEIRTNTIYTVWHRDVVGVCRVRCIESKYWIRARTVRIFWYVVHHVITNVNKSPRCDWFSRVVEVGRNLACRQGFKKFPQRTRLIDSTPVGKRSLTHIRAQGGQRYVCETTNKYFIHSSVSIVNGGGFKRNILAFIVNRFSVLFLCWSAPEMYTSIYPK